MYVWKITKHIRGNMIVIGFSFFNTATNTVRITLI